MKNYGTLLKKIRQEKGLSQKDIYSGIMTRQTYYLIETNVSMPSFDKFLMILEKLFLSTEEFLSLLNPEIFPAENQLYYKLSQAVFKKDKNHLDLLVQTSKHFYQTTKNEKYLHLNLITRAMLHLSFIKQDSDNNESLDQLMMPIKNYLIGVDKWYLYELKLLNNSLYCFSLAEAISLTTLVTQKGETFPFLEEYQDTKIRIYLNLSYLCLHAQDYTHTKLFSNLAKQNAQTEYRLFETIASNLNYEIAQSASTSKQLNSKIKKYLEILETLDYQNVVDVYQEILDSNNIS
ncbi:hypothetical protein DOK67_0001597 [Enterococcus sp. DIV0212c]|uniref:helix-turn-helix domain-containing protein n=1 Tax=Enterococcus sp. DIV0212c TaxID=2230867 RepID=UPI001A9B4839|nr:Rgg/GadR/MutR family transcriptional regulator [Enterococcus sp. DIV0212c]MBO1354197.1 helix-turn-helix domain-containing protein [Enterococcus sp. DIV0212c]